MQLLLMLYDAGAGANSRVVVCLMSRHYTLFSVSNTQENRLGSSEKT
jgi:hypothetical protein